MTVANLRLVPDTQILALHKHPDALEGFIFGGDDDETVTHAPTHELDLGEDWAAVDQVLADLAFIGKGGRKIGELAEGPARSFSSADVAALAQKLGSLSDGDVKKRAKKAGAEVLETVQQLKKFVATAATKKLGMVAYLA